MLIRPAHTCDLDLIRTCAQEAYGQYIDAIGRAPAPMNANFAEQIAEGHLYVGETEAGLFAGYIAFFRVGDYVHLDSIAVSQSAQNQGMGKQLLQFCEKCARERGLMGVRLYTNEKMTANLAIYSRLGFHETERRHDDGYARVFFEKTF